jgi:hypothetical protein
MRQEYFSNIRTGILKEASKGTAHGTGYSYDTHVPVVFMGWNIPHGQSSRYVSITGIAPTLSMLLNIRLQNGATGQPILEVFL